MKENRLASWPHTQTQHIVVSRIRTSTHIIIKVWHDDVASSTSDVEKTREESPSSGVVGPPIYYYLGVAAIGTTTVYYLH